MAGFAAQTRTPAIRALLGVQIFGEFFFNNRRVGFLVPPFQVGNHAFEGMFLDVGFSAFADIGEADGGLAGTVKHGIARFLRQFAERHFDVETVMGRQSLQHLEIKLVATIPTLDRTGGQRHFGKCGDPLRVEERDRAKTVAALAGACRIVERKQAGFELGRGKAALRAGEACGVGVLLAAVHVHRDGASVAMAQCRFERLGKTLSKFFTNFYAVNNDVDGVLGVLFQRRQRIDVMHLAVKANAHETLCPQFVDQCRLFALAVIDHRREDHQFGVLGHLQCMIDHLRHRLRSQHDVVLGAMRFADARIEQAQVVMDFGDRADRRTRIVAGGFLFDGNGRRQTLDHVDVGFFHQLQELPGIGRQRFDVAALALCVKRVECQRRFA